MSRAKKWSIGVLILLLMVGGYARNEYKEAKLLHMMQTAGDAKFERALSDRLKKNGSVNISDLVSGDWQQFCISPPYADVSKLNANSQLKKQINAVVNAGSRLFFLYNNYPSEGRWWLFTVKDGNVDKTFRLSGRLLVPSLSGVNIPICQEKKHQLKLKKKVNIGHGKFIYTFDFMKY